MVLMFDFYTCMQKNFSVNMQIDLSSTAEKSSSCIVTGNSSSAIVGEQPFQ